MKSKLSRRQFLRVALGAGAAIGARPALADVVDLKQSLLTIPVEVIGDWGGSIPESARRVILWMRAACLRGVRTLSDRQPERLRIEDRSSGPPAIWLHPDPATTAWAIVDISARDWSKLAYQFGHELGHIFANSWNVAAWPRPPCQWLEEALVEAFSVRGLGRLAQDWSSDPPFPGDNAFSGAIAQYRADLVARYRAASAAEGGDNLPLWFAAHRGDIEVHGGVRDLLGPVVLALAAEYETDVGCVEDLGALNRWPERSALPIGDYLSKWRTSCAEIAAPGRLPDHVQQWLGVT